MRKVVIEIKKASKIISELLSEDDYGKPRSNGSKFGDRIVLKVITIRP